MDNQQYLKQILPLLAAPMPYKWREQSFSTFKPEATCVAYIDARDVMDRLDSVCIYGWLRKHEEIKGHIYCSVGIVMPDGSIQWRMDCGTESDTEAEKGESSDSFKRASVNWGPGRFLYDLKIVKLPANEKKIKGPNGNKPYIIDDKGSRVWNLTDHINKIQKNAVNNKQPPKIPSNQTISDDQFKQLTKALDDSKSDKVAFCRACKIESLSAMPAAMFDGAMAKIKEKMESSLLAQMQDHHLMNE
mgnify:CR=1 FL=1